MQMKQFLSDFLTWLRSKSVQEESSKNISAADASKYANFRISIKICLDLFPRYNLFSATRVFHISFVLQFFYRNFNPLWYCSH